MVECGAAELRTLENRPPVAVRRCLDPIRRPAKATQSLERNKDNTQECFLEEGWRGCSMLTRLWATLARRNVATMGSLQRPAKPLVVVLGSTGTGKSEVRFA